MFVVSPHIRQEWKCMATLIARFSNKPTSSEVLTAYLTQCNEPPWTSYFVKYSYVKDDQFGMSNFNWKGAPRQPVGRRRHPARAVGVDNRAGEGSIPIFPYSLCYPLCALGIPCLLYGLAATQLIRHEELVHTSKGPVPIYFLLPEDKGSLH
ncbi:uncharacterized protein C15orf61 homolog isoform X2 [Bombyx mori]|uniref:Uncharacterized protein n=1 Tax=Bombyx mori TaxID=7091 RepID=A0A8R2R825_BOMMO|nr:uncharacterized protein LOC100101190 isoform X2 [Bombyx mori]